MNTARILCVEDNELEGRALVALVSREGWDVDLVATGERALEAFRECDYPLVLVDWRLPGNASSGAKADGRGGVESACKGDRRPLRGT